MIGPPDRYETLLDEALGWQRQLAGDDPDWDGFTAWLEIDPQHRHAFNEISLVERIVDERRDELQRILPAADKDTGRRSPQWRRGVAASVAAALAIAIAVPTFWPRPADTVYATRLGETRQLALADGTKIDLAPSSQLIVDGANPNALTLQRGEAFFAVRHDPRRALSIHAGGYTITDIGTKFAINLGEGSMRTGVAEGHVAITGKSGAATNISAGEQLIAMAGGAAQRSAVAVKDIGSWRNGRLVYRDAPLSMVVADIARYSAQKISVEPKLKERRFSGVLTIGDGSDLLANLARLMGLDLRQEGDHARVGSAPAR
jgi:transmembrane sensor